MIRLRNVHRGNRALVICGGPSLLALGFDFTRLQGRGFVTFLETKALTPHLLQSGFVPDYYLMSFPEKAKDNSLQQFVYRSLLAGFSIDWLLRREYRQVAVEMKKTFHEHFEVWRPERGLHKRYRWRPDVYLRDSPYELLQRVPHARVLVNRSLVHHYFPNFAYADRAFYFDQAPAEPTFDADKYFNPVERDDAMYVRCTDTFLNSAAITFYPLLHYMGFREAFFLGMDMSMLGSLEYAAPFTFRSMVHFWWFFRRTRHVFNANFQPNRRFYMRPQSEFDDLRALWGQSPVRFTRVYEPWTYATPVDGIPTIGGDQLFLM